MTDTEIVEWISKDPSRRLNALYINYDSGFCVGLNLRELARKMEEFMRGEDREFQTWWKGYRAGKSWYRSPTECVEMKCDGCALCNELIARKEFNG